MSMIYRTRFAPSPTGYLHLGHAYSAMTAYGAARAHGGEMIVRIEDIDHTRCRPAFEAAIFEDLTWLGLSWPTPVLCQSLHLADYRTALQRLKAMGVIYADTRTRASDAVDALSAPQEGYNRDDEAQVTALRLSLDAARRHLGQAYESLHFVETGCGPDGQIGIIRADPSRNGDVILGRKDIGLSYHLCVVIDDARQGISHIHRGHDLFDATHTQVLLQKLLGLATPVYCHHPLLLDNQGHRLAKRKGSKSLRDYRLEAKDATEIIKMIAAAPKS
jgi:glutamyl-Q tRNA(Asp) synthetase